MKPICLVLGERYPVWKTLILPLGYDVYTGLHVSHIPDTFTSIIYKEFLL